MNTIAPPLQSRYILCPSKLCGAAKDTMTHMDGVQLLETVWNKLDNKILGAHHQL